MLAVTRPDGALFAGALGAGLVLFHRAWRPALLVVAITAAALVLQLAFRQAYYGTWLPNTAHAKLAFSAVRAREGAEYVGGALLYLAPIGVAALGLRRSSNATLRPGLATLALLFWLAYVTSIGGDIFPARRHSAPLVVLFAVLFGDAAARAEASRKARWLVVGALSVFALAQHFDPQNQRARTERWEWDGEVIGRLLQRAFADQRPLLAADPAGTLGYFSELPLLDMLGLNDRYLATHPPEDMGSGWLGHELGDGAYVLDRKPDLILFTTPGGGAPRFRSAREISEDPRFQRDYRLVLFHGKEPYSYRSGIWVRESGRVGVRREEGRVVVPGHLLSAQALNGSAAELDADGRIGTGVSEELSAGIRGLELPAGTWRVRLERSGGPLQWQVRESATQAVLGQGPKSKPLRLDAPARIDFEVRVATGEAAHVTELVFRRTP